MASNDTTFEIWSEALVASFEECTKTTHTLRLTRTLRCGVVAVMALQGQGGVAEAKSHEAVAISASVTGDDQRVGFRALLMKQAIKYNLAGNAKNAPNNVVEFTLQGRSKRINEALETIRDGTRGSSKIEVTTAPAAVDPTL